MNLSLFSTTNTSHSILQTIALQTQNKVPPNQIYRQFPHIRTADVFAFCLYSAETNILHINCFSTKPYTSKYSKRREHYL